VQHITPPFGHLLPSHVDVPKTALPIGCLRALPPYHTARSNSLSNPAIVLMSLTALIEQIAAPIATVGSRSIMHHA